MFLGDLARPPLPVVLDPDFSSEALPSTDDDDDESLCGDDSDARPVESFEELSTRPLESMDFSAPGEEEEEELGRCGKRGRKTPSPVK